MKGMVAEMLVLKLFTLRAPAEAKPVSTIGVKSCGSSLARSEGSEVPKMAGPDWFQIEAFFNYIPYSN